MTDDCVHKRIYPESGWMSLLSFYAHDDQGSMDDQAQPLFNHHKHNKIQKHFQNVMLVGMASKISKTTHTSVWIAQDTTESRVPRLNVHTNQILAHTFSLGTLDSVVS